MQGGNWGGAEGKYPPSLTPCLGKAELKKVLSLPLSPTHAKKGADAQTSLFQVSGARCACPRPSPPGLCAQGGEEDEDAHSTLSRGEADGSVCPLSGMPKSFQVSLAGCDAQSLERGIPIPTCWRWAPRVLSPWIICPISLIHEHTGGEHSKGHSLSHSLSPAHLRAHRGCSASLLGTTPPLPRPARRHSRFQ